MAELKTGAQGYRLKKTTCPVCNNTESKTLGIRGNREYFGADKNVQPHVYTNVVECEQCGFIFTNPMICGLEHLEQAHYDNPETYQSDEQGTIPQMFKRRLDYIATYKKGRTLLDVGAGKGEFLNVAKKAGWETSGIEPSPKFCRYAKEKYGMVIKQGFLQEDSFEKMSFDVVTLNHVLEHVDEPCQLLALLHTYLKTDGVLFIEVPNVKSALLFAADAYFRLKGLRWSSRLSPLHPPYHKYGYAEKSLRYVLNKAGYNVLGVKTFPEADRGGGSRNKKMMRRFRNLLSSLLNLVGNGELIAVVATKK